MYALRDQINRHDIVASPASFTRAGTSVEIVGEKNVSGVVRDSRFTVRSKLYLEDGYQTKSANLLTLSLNYVKVILAISYPLLRPV